MAAGPEVKTPVGEAPVIPLVLVGLGAYLAWFGIHYWGSDVKWPTGPVKDVLQGKGVPDRAGSLTAEQQAVEDQLQQVAAQQQAATAQLAAQQQQAGGGISPSIYNPNAYAQAIVSGAGASGGSAIAIDALRYQGKGYVWGGNASSPGNWDCSSFVSYVLGHDLGLPLPGGKWGQAGFPPHAHGPTTLEYMMFGQGVTQAQAQPGDLIVSVDHMGIIIDPQNRQYMSAHDPRDGTGTGGYPGGFPGGAPVYRRVA
jgi:cell wall-associated NlpC family hydrolase